MRFDLHMHTTRHSPDSEMDPFALVRRAQQLGLDGVVITEHDWLWTEPELEELRAKRNAERAGVMVNFEVADATKLEGLEDRFDTVIDSAFYHVFLDDEETQTKYLQALHRATKPGARLFMFEIGRHNVNGLQLEGLPAENFERVLSAAGWVIDHLGTTTYQANFGPETFAYMTKEMSDGRNA